MTYFLLPLKKATTTALIFIMMFSLMTPATVGAQEEGAGAAAACAAQVALGEIVASAKKALFVPTAPSSESIESAKLAKECLLDSIGIALRETLIRKITSSIVTWINSGFEGSPAFVTNIDQFLLDTADEAFGSFIYDETNFAHLCSPFQFDIRFALALSYSSDPGRPSCTLSSIVDNVETAIDDLSVEWDWEVFETISTDPSGNVFSSFILSQEDLSDTVANAIETQRLDINLGSGFLSYKKCKDGRDVNTYEGEYGRDEPCQIVTPGSTINDALTNQLKLDTDRLALADEFNEIIGALMGQLVKQAFGRDGVTGLSQRSGNSESFISRYNQDSTQASGELASSLANSSSQTTDAYVSYIDTQNQAIQSLLQAKIQITEAYACYDSKYNTWVQENGSVINPTQIDSVPEADRSRASFITQIQNAIFADRGNFLDIDVLTSAESLQKALTFKTTLDRIDQDLLSAESNIADARTAAEQSAVYQARLQTTTDAREIQEIYNNFSTAVASSNIDSGLAHASLQNIDSYTDLAVNGTVSYTVDGQVRSGGAVQELAICQTYNQAIAPGQFQ